MLHFVCELRESIFRSTLTQNYQQIWTFVWYKIIDWAPAFAGVTERGARVTEKKIGVVRE